jgi:hypothetical protein
MTTRDLPTTLQIRNEPDVVAVTIAGNITDHSDLSALAGVNAPKVVIDLEKLHRFNSGGIVIWMRALQGLCSNAKSVEIRNAPHGFTHPYSMIRGFAASARIESVQVVYRCDRCDSTKPFTLERSEHFPDGRLVTAFTPDCPRCQMPMTPDDPLFDSKLQL